MVNKKILLSLCLILLVAMSVSAISAADSEDVVATDDSTDVIASDNSDVLSTTYQPDNDTYDAVQSAVNKANKTGDIVDLSKYSTYNLANNTVKISKEGIIIDGNGTTTITGFGDGNGIFYINAKNVTIKGIKFVDTNPKNDFKYNGTVEGCGITASAANGGEIKNCEFTDFSSGVIIMQTVGYNIENSKFNGGYTTKLYNDPTVNKETGTKALNIYKQSEKIIIKNNTFDGPILDGVSIAQGSGSNQVINNIFINNCYSIYFGGASTKGTIIKNNTFINCGYFKEGNLDWKGLPVISIQKASDSVSIVDNTFKAIENNILIAAEKGNEAHGAPTDIGDINITGNIVEKYNPTVNASSITLFNILARTSSLTISSPLNITGNTLPEGSKSIALWINDNEVYTSTGDKYIEYALYDAASMFNTTIKVSDISITQGDSANLQISLVSSDGVGLVNKVLLVSVNGNVINVITDSYGAAVVPVNSTTAGTQYVSIVYLGEGSLYAASMTNAKITVNAKPTPAPVVTIKATKLTGKKATLKVKKAKNVQFTLKSGSSVVAGKKITVTVNKKTFSAKTNKKGVATIKVKVNKKGSFKAVAKFAGDSAYKASSVKVTFVVK